MTGERLTGFAGSPEWRVILSENGECGAFFRVLQLRIFAGRFAARISFTDAVRYF